MNDNMCGFFRLITKRMFGTETIIVLTLFLIVAAPLYFYKIRLFTFNYQELHEVVSHPYNLTETIERMTYVSPARRARCLSIIDDEDLCSYSFIFLHGFHHSGTTAIYLAFASLFPQISALKGQMQNEGQYLTSVYPSFKEINFDACFGYSMNTFVPQDLSKWAKILWKNWKWQWDWSKSILMEKDPMFYTVDIKGSLFPTSSHVFVMRHPWSIACKYSEYCNDAKRCLLVFVKQWINVLLKIQSGLRAIIICFEGFIQDHSSERKRRNLDYHLDGSREFKMDRKYMRSKKADIIFGNCEGQRDCMKYVRERNVLANLFCGFDLVQYKFSFREDRNEIAVTWEDQSRIVEMLKVLYSLEENL